MQTPIPKSEDPFHRLREDMHNKNRTQSNTMREILCFSLYSYVLYCFLCFILYLMFFFEPWGRGRPGCFNLILATTLYMYNVHVFTNLIKSLGAGELFRLHKGTVQYILQVTAGEPIAGYRCHMYYYGAHTAYVFPPFIFCY